jgi:type I restriction enzyme M protein
MDASVKAVAEATKGIVKVAARQMTANHFQQIEKFETDLWKIADNLRANSNLASNEYFMPIMGLIFLRHATNRFYEAKAAIEADKKAGKMPDRPLVDGDFTRRRALNLPESARFDVILKTPAISTVI